MILKPKGWDAKYAGYIVYDARTHSYFKFDRHGRVLRKGFDEWVVSTRDRNDVFQQLLKQYPEESIDDLK